MKRVMIAIVAVTLAACGAGRDDSNVDGGRIPYFRPAPGWEAVQLGTTATTANISLGQNTLSGEGPWDTVERLEGGDVLLCAMFWPAGKADLPPRELPLSLADAEPGGLEGQPADIYAELPVSSVPTLPAPVNTWRLKAQVGGWNMYLLIFYGGTEPTGVRPAHTDPSIETVAAAQEQLARLAVPAHG